MYLNRRPILSAVFPYSFIPVGVPATVGRDPDVNQCHLTQMYGLLVVREQVQVHKGLMIRLNRKFRLTVILIPCSPQRRECRVGSPNLWSDGGGKSTDSLM